MDGLVQAADKWLSERTQLCSRAYGEQLAKRLREAPKTEQWSNDHREQAAIRAGLIEAALVPPFGFPGSSARP